LIKIYPHNPPPVLCYYYTMLTQNLEEPISTKLRCTRHNHLCHYFWKMVSDV